jgi:hypothetical protein
MDETEDTKQWAGWQGRLSASRRRREDRVSDWQRNVRKRTGETRSSSAETTTITETGTAVSVNKDHPLTGSKIALLYSQNPELRLSTTNQQAGPVVQQFAGVLNATILKANVGARIEEELADVINAAGIGGVVIACEKRTEMRDMPSVDPMIAAMTGQPLEMIPVETVVDLRYPVRRISPASLLVPSDFTGSTYDDARWLGYDDSLPWVTAKSEFKISDENKDKVCASDKRGASTTNSLNTDTEKYRDSDVVNFTEVFYWRHFYHADETNFQALQRVVFVEGLEEPVINEPYAGQKRLPDGRVVGVKRNPIQVLTLTYISDDCLPPSDSTISRNQVSQLEDSRETFRQQRKHSINQNWFDATRVSPNTRSLLEKGKFQAWLPINGPGDRAFGEIPRSPLTQEKFELDGILDREITDQWTVGPNQAGNFASGERSAREAGIVENNFKTRIGQQRGKVERHFVGIGEVIGSLMALHGNVGIPVEVLDTITFSIRVDSTVLLDVQQRIEQIKEFTNLWGQSGVANIKALAVEHAELLGMDPGKFTIDPQPKAPEPVKVSVSKMEDMNNPLMLAELSRTNQLPTPEDVAAVTKLLTALGQIPGVAALMTPPTPESSNPNQQPSEVATPGISNANWQEQPRINKRDEDGGA